LKLLSGNDLFFCDWKIYNLLRQPLGKVFYDKKKYPFPIDCEDVPEDLKSKFATYEQYINDLGNHSYFMMGNGPV
jgi:ribosome biogenesis protein UTP30